MESRFQTKPLEKDCTLLLDGVLTDIEPKDCYADLFSTFMNISGLVIGKGCDQYFIWRVNGQLTESLDLDVVTGLNERPRRSLAGWPDRSDSL